MKTILAHCVKTKSAAIALRAWDTSLPTTLGQLLSEHSFDTPTEGRDLPSKELLPLPVCMASAEVSAWAELGASEQKRRRVGLARPGEPQESVLGLSLCYAW